jgi:hypothetical protein
VPEDAEDAPEVEEPAPAASDQADQPTTEKKIPEGGSLFDL